MKRGLLGLPFLFWYMKSQLKARASADRLAHTLLRNRVMKGIMRSRWKTVLPEPKDHPTTDSRCVKFQK